MEEIQPPPAVLQQPDGFGRGQWGAGGDFGGEGLPLGGQRLGQAGDIRGGRALGYEAVKEAERRAWGAVGGGPSERAAL